MSFKSSNRTATWSPFRKLIAWVQRHAQKYATRIAGGAEATGPDPFTGTPVVPDELSSPDQLEEGEQPWKVRDEWAQGRVTSERGSVQEGKGGSGRNSVGRLSLGGVLCVGVALFLLIKSESVAGFILWFTIGTGLFSYAGYQLARRWRFGETTFEMATVPGELGGHLCGTIHAGLPAGSEPEDGMRVRLSCYRRRRLKDNDGEGSSISRTLLWRDEKQVECRHPSDGDGLEVPVAFDLPEDAPASTPEATESRIMWVLEASAAVPGVDYSAVMEVPVFPVEPDTSVPVDRYTQYEKDIGGNRAGGTTNFPASDGIDAKRADRGTFEASVAAGRFPYRASFATLGALVLGAVSVPALMGGLIMIIFVIPALFSLVLAIITLSIAFLAYYLWTYGSHVRVDGQGVHVRSGMAGLRTTTHVPCAAVEDLWLEGRRYPPRDTYDLFLAQASDSEDRPEGSPDGDSEKSGEIVVAQMLPNHQEAEWIVSQIGEAVAWHSPEK